MTTEQELLLEDEGGPTGEGRRCIRCNRPVATSEHLESPGSLTGLRLCWADLIQPSWAREDCCLRAGVSGDKARPMPAPSVSREERLRALGFEHNGPSDVNRFAHGSPPASSPVPAAPPVDACGPVSHREAREILSMFVDEHFENPGARRPTFSIPANPRRDSDLRLNAYIRQQEAKDRLPPLPWHMKRAPSPPPKQASTATSPVHDVEFTEDFLRQLSEDSRAEESLYTPPEAPKGETAPCADWCGIQWIEIGKARGETLYCQHWCSEACRTAGRRLGDPIPSPESTGGGK